MASVVLGFEAWLHDMAESKTGGPPPVTAPDKSLGGTARDEHASVVISAMSHPRRFTVRLDGVTEPPFNSESDPIRRRGTRLRPTTAARSALRKPERALFAEFRPKDRALVVVAQA